MAQIRFDALKTVLSRKPLVTERPLKKTSEYFGENVFSRNKMQEYLSAEAYSEVINAIDKGTKINRKMADQIASGMKFWAIEKGATHYTHWFHPLNGASAEKHDAFFEPSENGGVIENFHGKLLVQQEPDASSFPSGGIRNTFEARGYTAWDPTSPAFLIDKTLCIPTIFVSYTGEALDYKTPLLKSLAALDESAVAVCNLFDKNVTKVYATLGIEQEYFLVDEALFQARPDLVLTGRTLIGHASAKYQQLEDHYFGVIPDRIHAFMKDYEYEALRLGIPIKTRHNEVAPSQFECAPVFEEANLAVDHNQLLMILMEKIAKRHNLRVLFNEKPYKGINGSGKHNNWSLMTDSGRNLLSPGKTPKNNLQFLAFLINTIKAVHEHADLLRASIVSAGNEHRLGASEAPPSIMSVFIGEKLAEILGEIEKRVTSKKMSPDEKTEIKLDIGKIPPILLDNTDRNRTSPFAFTGNRFEFRAVGSGANCAAPMIALNTAVAGQLRTFMKDIQSLTRKKVKKDEAIFQVLRKYIVESKNIIFDGNGYGDEWIKEAARRGLTNIKSAPDALNAFLTPASKELFSSTGVFNDRELEARYEIRLEIYIKKIQIEARVLGDLVKNHIIPIAFRYQNLLIENVRGMKEIIDGKDFMASTKTQIYTIKEISEHVNKIDDMVDRMIEKRKNANLTDDIRKKVKMYSDDIKPFFDEIRYHVDKLELITDDEMWPLPKYRELLFNK